MSMLAQTDDGDIAVANNGFSIVDKDAEIRQRVINALRSFFREWFLDETLGVPWFQAIFVKGTPSQVIDALLKDEILGVPGVVSLEEFRPLDLDVQARTLSVDFRCRTVNSTLLRVQETLP